MFVFAVLKKKKLAGLNIEVSDTKYRKEHISTLTLPVLNVGAKSWIPSPWRAQCSQLWIKLCYCRLRVKVSTCITADNSCNLVLVMCCFFPPKIDSHARGIYTAFYRFCIVHINVPVMKSHKSFFKLKTSYNPSLPGLWHVTM